MNFPRSCGTIMHITSLPSPFGIGDLGPSAFRFADFLKSAAITYWQILPLNYTEEGSGFSPYSGLSAFAGNTLVISPEILFEDGLLDKKDLLVKEEFDESEVEFPKVVKYKSKLLDKAYRKFKTNQSLQLNDEFAEFCNNNQEWLRDYSLYVSIKSYLKGKSWSEWPPELKNRKPEAIDKIKEVLKDQIDKENFLQFIFFKQWNNLKSYCHEQSVKFIGDLPFYIGFDSADVWSQAQYFKLDDDKEPLLVAGVPPDYFSETGQLWGMPIFDWDALERDGYTWWLRRIEQNIKMYDLLRLDHFRAFSAYWEVPSNETTAINGSWTPGPGEDFFKLLKKKFPMLPLIAEDLGEIDQPVRDLMTQFHLPGMRVLQFAFGEDIAKNAHAPHNYVPNCIVYTGTHDNNTSRGWFDNDLSKDDRKRLSNYINKKIKRDKLHWNMIRLALQSVGQLAVFPVQDIFGFGQEAIMNRPSTVTGNWSWRVAESYFTPKIAKKLKELIQLFGREVEQKKDKKIRTKRNIITKKNYDPEWIA